MKRRGMTQETREKLVRTFGMAVKADVLDEADAAAILDICSEACERAKAAVMEHFLAGGTGGDADGSGPPEDES